jgi:hypothetical protein
VGWNITNVILDAQEVEKISIEFTYLSRGTSVSGTRDGHGRKRDHTLFRTREA